MTADNYLIPPGDLPFPSLSSHRCPCSIFTLSTCSSDPSSGCLPHSYFSSSRWVCRPTVACSRCRRTRSRLRSDGRRRIRHAHVRQPWVPMGVLASMPISHSSTSAQKHRQGWYHSDSKETLCRICANMSAPTSRMITLKATKSDRRGATSSRWSSRRTSSSRRCATAPWAPT